MNPPKMPIHIGDYKRDTGHLRAAQHGAYLMLLFHHWSTGSLPDDDDQLAAIACMTRAEWKRSRSVIEKFFDPGWRHGRVEEDLEKAKQAYQARAKAGEKGGKAKAEAKQCSSNATARPEQPYTLDQGREDSEVRTSALNKPFDDVEVVNEDPKARLFRLGKPILISFGITEKRTGSLIGQWLKAQNDPPGILAALEFARAQNVAEPVAYVSALIHGKHQNGAADGNDRKPGESLGDLGRRLAAEARELERAADTRRSDDAFGVDRSRH